MSSSEPRDRRSRVRRVLGSILYWAAVLAISLALVVALVLFIESRDASEIDRDAGARAGPVAEGREGSAR
jgi:hypothetical protein